VSYADFYTYRLKDEQLDALQNLLLLLLLPSSDGRRIRISSVVTAGVDGIYWRSRKSGDARSFDCKPLRPLRSCRRRCCSVRSPALQYIHLGGNGLGWQWGWRRGIYISTTSSRASAIVVDRNILRRRCYGPETSAV
jgi:hypothetical protein